MRSPLCGLVTEVHGLSPAEREHDDGYRLGYMAGHADALDVIAHLIRRGVADPLARVRRWHWKHLRPWAERLVDGERPDFCRRDRHGEHYEAGDDDD